MIDARLPEIISRFCKEQQSRWSKSTLLSAKYSLFHLHQWMQHQHLSYADLTIDDVQKFVESPNGSAQKISSQKATLTRIKIFLLWLSQYQELKIKHDLTHRPSPPVSHLRSQTPATVFQFCDARKTHWASPTLQSAYYCAASLHRWMKKNQFTWDDLTSERMQNFFERPNEQKNTYASFRLLRRYTRSYLHWLHENGLISIDPGTFLGPYQIHFRIRSSECETPETITRFIYARQKQGWKDRPGKYKYILKRFHIWLEMQGFTLSAIIGGSLDEFLTYSKTQGSSHRYREVARRYLTSYLGWLQETGEIRLSNSSLPKQLGSPHHHLPAHLPKYAEDFLRFLSINLRPSSVSNYQDSLRHFHAFLKISHVGPRNLTRKHLEQFMGRLKEKGLSIVWRKKILVAVRIYLNWLQERGLISINVTVLLRGTDFPKLPFYLPRPLPPEVDAELLQRLANSEDILGFALLLMRHTGLRISELKGLGSDCLRTDHMGRHFLKVPLGKLHSERMVPLMPASVALIGKIKAMSAENLRHSAIAKDPEFLIYGLTGRNPDKAEFRVALQDACHGIKLKEPITSHRLRHTCATSLLNAGMSLVAIMRLLGHKSTGMTLRYAAVSPETVRREFEAAIATMEKRHQLQDQLKIPLRTNASLDGCFNDLLQVIKTTADARGNQREQRLSLMIKRFHRLKRELDDFLKPEKSL